MALDLSPKQDKPQEVGNQIPNIFPHSRQFDQGLGKVRAGQATVVVALDGSGDFNDIQSAINSIPSGIGGSIYVKEGIYTIHSPITVSKQKITIRGAGKASKIILADGVNDDAIQVSSAYFVLDNLWIEGNQANQSGTSRGIDISGQKVIIQNCYIFNFLTSGIHTSGFYALIQGNTIEICGDSDDIGKGGIVLATSTGLCTVQNNFITLCKFAGISTSSTNDNSIISNNVLYYNDDAGIYAYLSDHIIISGNACKHNQQGIVAVALSTSSITNNVCNVSTTDGFLFSGCIGLSIIGNTATANEHHGFDLIDTSDSLVSNNIAIGNDNSNAATYDGIIVRTSASQSNRNIIAHNRSKNNDRNEIRINDSDCNRNLVSSNMTYGTDRVSDIVDNGTNTVLLNNQTS